MRQPLRGGVALVHAEQVAGKQRRLVAAGAGADFEDGVLLVGGVLGQQQYLDFLPQRLDALLDAGQVCLGQRPHLGVGALVGEHRLEVGEFAFRPEKLPDPGRDVLKIGIFGSQLDIGFRVRPGRHLRFEHVETLDELVHPVAGQADHDRAIANITRKLNGTRSA